MAHVVYLRFLVLLVLVFSACGGESTENQSDTGYNSDSDVQAGEDISNDEAGAPDASDDVGGGPVIAQAVLERVSKDIFACEVTRDTTNHQPLKWLESSHPLLALEDGSALFVRAESEAPSPFDFAPATLRVSSMNLDGTLGASSEISDDGDGISGVASAISGNKVLAVWANKSMFLAVRGLDGSEIAPPVNLGLGASADYGTRPAVAMAASGDLGLVFSVPSGSHRNVVFVRLNGDGEVVGDVVNFTTASPEWDNPAPSIAAGDGGWAMTWQETVEDRGAVYFASVDLQGKKLVDRKRISSVDEKGTVTTTMSFASPRNPIVSVAGGWIAAWTEARQGVDYSSGASAIIKVVRLNQGGVTLQEAPVRDIVVDNDEVEPMLVPFQGAIGLFWSSGTHIYMCGGCFPDHRVDFVLLDPESLDPVSNVVSLTPTPNGLLDLSAAVLGDDLLLTYRIYYHVYQDPASASVTCTK